MTIETGIASLPQRPKRADAARNYDALITAAREAFTEDGADASLEGIARRAGVGIGTLYRNFATRQALLEAVYIDEVEEMARAGEDVAGLDPWDALAAWLHQYIGFAQTKRALAEQMMATVDKDAEVFLACRTALTTAGDKLLSRAQEAGVVRADTDFADVGRMVGGIAGIQTADREQIDRILDVALDGLRYSR